MEKYSKGALVMADKDEVNKIEEIVNSVYERIKEEVDAFDRYLTKANDMDCLEEFVESYLNLRESGLDFKDAYITAAEEREVELEDEEDK